MIVSKEWSALFGNKAIYIHFHSSYTLTYVFILLLSTSQNTDRGWRLEMSNNIHITSNKTTYWSGGVQRCTGGAERTSTFNMGD